MIMKKIMAGIVSLQLLLVPVAAHAEEIIANVSEGEPAPFSGTLFNPEASARIIISLEHAEKSCDLRISEAQESLTARHTFEMEILQSSLTSCNELCATRLDIRHHQIDFLNNELAKKKPTNQALYFIIGTVLGVGLTLGTSYTYSNIVN
jgi:hypothetical protein